MSQMNTPVISEPQAEPYLNNHQLENELKWSGINPELMFDNDTFCETLQKYRKGKTSLNHLLQLAERIAHGGDCD